MRKAQGLPFTVIVIAALCLAILFILMYATMGKLKFFSKGVHEEAEIKDCSEFGVEKSIIECANPLLGNYGTKDPKNASKIIPMSPNMVCCPR